ncbi:MAG: glycerol-3-phosphate 1-O-acyltransferase PlsY [Candidatus Omnitrophica bacterium]|nr:glycerol-3-phosphate 1-O-acyltransferase PlsY [Candidatus Omnitrophota bacterium]MDD5725356.1 glycerol-3-phosphate 1-O-acyltransferase PlsY [Candidatus Omnitrophota bacterium]
MATILAALLISYLIGSVPTAYIFGRILKGIDIRKEGSGNVGATNALRVLGKGPGIAVLIFDIFKGFLVAFFLADYFSARIPLIDPQNTHIMMGLACICGHNWTIFLRFKGGKGIASTFGVLLGLSWRIPGLGAVIAVLVATWFAVFLVSRIVSLASVLSAVAFPVSSFFLKLPPVFTALSLLLSLFVLIRHRANLIRIFQGKEPRLYFGKPKT